MTRSGWTASRRAGRINLLWIGFLASAVALAGLVGLIVAGGKKPRASDGASGKDDGPKTLLVYCAPAVQKPVKAVADEYQKQFNVTIQLDYGPSQTLLTRIETGKTGDLFIPADDSYLSAGKAKGLVDEILSIAKMRPVLVVGKGNPKSITSVDDLTREAVRTSLAEPGAAIHKIVQDALTKAGKWDAIKDKALSNGTVADVANSVRIGAIDAGFVWTGMLSSYPDLQPVALPLLDGVEGKIAIGVLRSTKQPTEALKFARYLAARDKGQLEFKKSGYETVPADAWSEVPQLRLMAGAMLRPAIEETLIAFEKREGCSITRDFDGCGILVAKMKINGAADAYFACDTSFMKQVADLYVDPEEISGNQLVIVVPKGNPKSIKALKDLGRDNLRIGVGHEKQCALGALTKETLIQDGTYAAVQKNVKVTSPTGDTLVNQLRTGSLDAVVAYVSNIASARDQLDGIPIDIPCAIAAQPLAAAKEGAHPQITRRLIEALTSRQSKERFLANNFSWKGTGGQNVGKAN